MVEIQVIKAVYQKWLSESMKNRYFKPSDPPTNDFIKYFKHEIILETLSSSIIPQTMGGGGETV